MCQADNGACKSHICDHCGICKHNVCCRKDAKKTPAISIPEKK